MLPVNDGDNEIDLGIDNDNNDAHDFVPVEEHADGGNNTQENDVNQNDGNNQIDLGTIVVSDKKKCNGKSMVFCVVQLANDHMIVVRNDWVQEPKETKTKIFFSPNIEDQPVFGNTMHYFKDKEVACYVGRVHKCFSKFLLNKADEVSLISKHVIHKYYTCSRRKTFYEDLSNQTYLYKLHRFTRKRTHLH